MFGMLSVLAELQRELIIANTRDGLAAARLRGRKGGRRPRLNPEQAILAQQLYDAGGADGPADRGSLRRAPHHRLRPSRRRDQGQTSGGPTDNGQPIAPDCAWLFLARQVQRVIASGHDSPIALADPLI
jgi:hypothetical protein